MASILFLLSSFIKIFSVLVVCATYAQEEAIHIQTIKRTGKTWPLVKASIKLKASPLESVAIFAAFDYQKNYIPNLVKSEVYKQISPTNISVKYELKMPWPLSNGHYIHGHHLSSPKTNVYKVVWYLIESDSADDVSGTAIFSALPNGETKMTYESAIDPKGFFAGIVKKFMIRDVKNSIEAIKKTIESVKQNEPKLLIKYKHKITMALKGEKPY